jgi:RimJ/RimL family protein N-acetyltransferase
VRLLAAADAHFAWMLTGEGSFDGLRLPAGGVDQPGVLKYLRRLAGALGSWLVIEDGEVAGLCGHKHAPTADGAVEIGYGIAAARRGRGLATRAVAAMLDLAAEDPRIRALTAETAADNIASQRVLEKNGFIRVGTRVDPEDGALILWRSGVPR